MSKSHDARKNLKKKPQKTLKEKRQEKREKRDEGFQSHLQMTV
jgi:hypothetical protein